MQQAEPRKSDKWIPWYFVAFFAVIALLDGIFVTIATSTHRGVVTEQAYQKGLDYNATVAAADAQAALGWQGNIMLADNRHLVFTLQDRKNTPLTHADVVAYFSRPAQAGLDFSVKLEEKGQGEYENTIGFPLEGQWEVRISAQWNGQQYQQSQRLFVKAEGQ